MPRRNKGIFLPDIYKALFERKTTQGRLNKLIDSVAEENFVVDEALHFTNEVIIHRHPRQHIRNTWKYGVKPRLKKMLDVI
jgi:hypothetical protein